MHTLLYMHSLYLISFNRVNERCKPEVCVEQHRSFALLRLTRVLLELSLKNQAAYL